MIRRYSGRRAIWIEVGEWFDLGIDKGYAGNRAEWSFSWNFRWFGLSVRFYPGSPGSLTWEVSVGR